MSASRGIVFSAEAVFAVSIFLALLLAILAVSHNFSSPDYSFEQSMVVAHDMLVNASDNPPEGYISDEAVCLSEKGYVAKLKVSDYELRHVEVCMK